MNDIGGKINSLSLGEKLIAGGGILMFVASFFRWFKVSAGPFSSGTSGWDDPGAIWSILAILVSIALAGLIVATRLGNMRAPNLPAGWTWGLVFGGGAAAVVILILLKAWRISAANCPLDLCDTSFGVGFFIGAIAAVIIAVGGYLLYTEDRRGIART